MNDAARLNLTYERRADDTVLLIHAQDETIDPLDSRLLLANPVPHLLPVSLYEEDARVTAEFLLGGRKPLSEWLRTADITEERLLHFLLHIGDMLWRLRDYLLIENRLLLLPEAMYIEDQLLDVKFVYWPDKRTEPDERQIAQQLKHLILHITKHGASHRVVRSIMDYCDDPSFTVGSLRKRLLVWLDQSSANDLTVDAVRCKPRDRVLDSKTNPLIKARTWLGLIRWQRQRVNNKRKDSTVSSSGANNRTKALVERSEQSSFLNEASLLIEQQGKQPRQTVIDRTPYMIGRDQQAVNLVNDDIQVSRIHAEIRRTEVGYVIRDLGSRNGTSINEEKLTPFTEYKLQAQDMIQMGDTYYLFQIEGKSML